MSAWSNIVGIPFILAPFIRAFRSAGGGCVASGISKESYMASSVACTTLIDPTADR